MAASRQWLETKPASTDKIKDAPAEFQLRWQDVRERWNAGGVVCDAASPLAEQGRHAVDASGVASPDIFKSDRVTPIIEWENAAATLASGYVLNGSKNIPEATVGDFAIGLDAKGYKRAIQEFAIFESNPVDTKVNVKAGIYLVGQKSAYHAGGQLTIGTAPLTLPAGGNKAQYAIVVDKTGTLTARKGTEVAFAGSTTSPDASSEDTLLGYIEIRADSISFSMAASGVNAFFVRDGRTIAPRLVAEQAAQGTVGITTANPAGVFFASKTITTKGGAVLVLITTDGSFTRLNRDGTNLFDGFSDSAAFIDTPSAGAHTYELRSTVSSIAIITLIELPFSTVS